MNGRAYVGTQQIAGGVGEIGGAFKSWATTETGATVVGVAGGIFVGEWIGSWVTDYLNVEDGWTKVLSKAVAKGALSFVLFMIGRRLPAGGVVRLVLNGASAGSLASIIGDVVGEYVAPGLGIISGGNTKNLNIKVNPNSGNPTNVGGRGQVITI